MSLYAVTSFFHYINTKENIVAHKIKRSVLLFVLGFLWVFFPPEALKHPRWLENKPS